MHWVMALLGAFLGSVFGGIDVVFLGLVAGAYVGWQGARIAQLRRRVEALESERRAASVPLAKPAAVVAPAVTAATAPIAPVSIAPAEHDIPPDLAAARDAADVARRVTEAARAAEARAQLPTSGEPPAPRAPAAPPPLRPPRGPDWFDRVGATARRWLFEGNVPVKLGMLVLFFGVAAALKYAAEQGYFTLPIEFRLAGIGMAGLAALVWGWRNRTTRPAFGLSLQGGAIGVLLLTTFAAFRLYGLLPAGVAFAVVLVLVAGAALLALLQDTVWLALLGFVGGYLAPVLISTGSGNHVALFGYYAVLNAAVFGIAWLKPWRALNLVGFGFTFAVGTLWGAKYYQPAHFATVEPFLVLFFLFYVAIAVLYGLRSRDDRRPLVDGTLVFGTPLLAFPLQAALLQDDRMGLAYSALAVALLYALLGTWLFRHRGRLLLGQSFAALAVGFATLAVPLALSARWTSASWAAEGAALVWLGLRQRRLLPQLAGWTLQALAAVAYFFSALDGGAQHAVAEVPIVNGHALGLLVMALAAWFVAWLYERAHGHRALVWLGFVLATGWWTLAGVRELAVHFDWLEPAHGLVAFAALTAGLAAVLRGAIPWARLGWLVLGVTLAGPPLVLFTELDRSGLLSFTTQAWWLAWFVILLYGLFRLREPHQRGLSLAHVLVLASAAWFYGLALHDLAVRAALDDGWRYVAGLLPLCALLLLTWRAPTFGAFPLAAEFERYRLRWFVPALSVLAIAWLAALAERGGSAPLPYVPLLNPVELFQLAALLLGIVLARRSGAQAEPFRPLLAGAAFLFLTFAGLRGVHHATGVPWSPAILDDRLAQATLTVLWSMLGVSAWIYGSRRRLWSVWLTGAILMGVVLVKLALVDRQYVGNLAGIVSLMVVGGLLVLVGRIAPTPPRARGAPEAPAVPDDEDATAAQGR